MNGALTLANDPTTPLQATTKQYVDTKAKTAALINSIDVRTMGAVGDGVTDDTAAIQSTINAAAASNLRVYIPSTTAFYKVSQSGSSGYALNVLSNTEIYGDGIFSTLETTDDTIRIFSASDVSNVKIRNLHLHGAYAGTGATNLGVAIYAEKVTTFEVSNVFSEYFSSCIYVLGSSATKESSEIRFTNNKLGQCGTFGIGLVATSADTDNTIFSNFLINGNTLLNGGYADGIAVKYGATKGVISNNIIINTPGNGVIVDSATNIVISGNYSENSHQAGIAIGQTGASLTTEAISVTGNVLFGNGSLNPSMYGGIFLTGISTLFSNILVNGNSIFGNAGNGISVLPAAGATSAINKMNFIGNTISQNSKDGIVLNSAGGYGTNGFLIEGNSVNGNAGYGFNFTSTTYSRVSGNKVFENLKGGVLLTTSNNVLVNGNEIHDNDFGGSNTYSGVQITSGSDNGIENNQIYNVISTKQIYGINLSAGAVYTQVKGNTLRNNVTAPILNSSASSNILNTTTSHDPLSGSFTLTAASSSSVISNQNIQSYSKIFLTPTNASAAQLMGAATHLFISSKTANISFTVQTGNGGNALGTETFDYIVQ